MPLSALIWVAGGAGALLALIAFRFALQSRWVRHLRDNPLKPQSAHTGEVPRLGGLVIGVVTASLVLMLQAWLPITAELRGVLLLTSGLWLISAIEDSIGVPALIRFLAHLGASAFALLLMLKLVTALPPFVSSASALLTSYLGVALLLLALTWIANAYNFMDGANGMLGIPLTIHLAILAFVAAQSGSAAALGVAALCTILVGTLIGFLFFNVPNARVFLGDAGSISLGYLVGALGLYGSLIGMWPLSLPICLMAPLMADASFTLIRRLVAGHHPARPHSTHYYQRLIRAGHTHLRVAIGYGAATFFSGITAVALQQQGAKPLLIIGLAVVTYVCLAAVLEWYLLTALKAAHKPQ